MKTTLTIILISFAVSVAGQTVTALGNKCVAYWDMETFSTTLTTSRVGTHDGTVSGAYSTGTGANGRGYTFDGLSDVINIADIALGNNQSISVWFKPSSPGLTYRHVIGRHYGNTAIAISGVSKINGLINGNNIQQSTTHTTNWYHAVVTKVSATNTVTLYINGSSIGTATDTDTELYPTDAWQIGAHGNSAQYWSGTIDEVGFFDEALTSDDVLALYNSGTCPDFDDWYYEPSSTYSPVAGRHVRLKAKGEYRMPTANGVPVYFKAKVPLTPTQQNFDIYYSKTFEELSSGAFSTSYLGTIYYQTGSARLTVADDIINGEATKALKITCPEDDDVAYTNDTYGTEIMPYIGSYDSVYISYRVRFDTNAPSTEGGKLFGVGGIPVPLTGSTDPNNSFKYRNMFKNGGRIVTYYHDNNSGSFLTSGTYPPYGSNELYINPGNWYDVTMRIVMNSSPSVADGVWETWVNGKLLYSYNNKQFYETTPNGNVDKVRYISITHFYGGGSDIWWPENETYANFDDITVWYPKEPEAVGRTKHSFAYTLPTPTALGPQVFVYDSLISAPQILSNTEFGGTYGLCKNETYLIDAGAGNTVTFDYSYDVKVDVWGYGDYLLIYDGNTTDSDLLQQHTGTGSAVTQSTGRYMFVRFVTNKATGGNGFTGTLTFN